MAGAQPANGANVKVNGCGIDSHGGREDVNGSQWAGHQKEDASQL
jgi:hypothetical protein